MNDQVLETIVSEYAVKVSRQVKEIAVLRDALSNILRHTYVAQDREEPYLYLIAAEARQALKNS